jgi:3-oxoacyl-[acyl-carrier protein] reductase
MDRIDLTNRSAIVTGAGRGIGRAIAIMLAEHGAHVIVAARTKSEIDETAAMIAHYGGSAFPVVLNLADVKSIQSLFSLTIKTAKGLDILVNNAGIGKYGAIADFSGENLQDVIDVNVRGTYLCCQEAMKLMIPKKSGYIINIASVVGFKGYPNQSAYTASKHAIVGLTKSLAAEAQAHQIRASVINPGGTDTDLIAAARPDLDPSILMQPEDVAQTVLFLLSLSERCAIDEIYIRRRSSQPF